MTDSIVVGVASQSRDGKYDVTLFADGRVYCNCPAWKFQHLHPDNRICKHTIKARAAAEHILGKKATRVA